MQARKSSGKESHDKAAADEVALALHYYGLSRHFAASGHPSLSTQNNHLARLIIAQSDQGASSELNRSSKHTLSDSLRTDSGLFSNENNGLLPQWQQIHNRTCTVCNSALLLGLNCRTVNKGIQCDVCGTRLIQLDADRDSKRKYRSIRVVRGKQSPIKIKSKGPSRKEALKNDKKIEVAIGALVESNTKADNDAERVVTLEEREKQMKKRKKKQKKWQKEKAVPRKMDWLGNSHTSKEEVTGMLLRSKQASIAINDPPSEVLIDNASKSSKKTGLQKLLAEKKLKKQNEEKTKEQQSGLQDFLGSLE